jgi:hypothetical protein
MTSRQVAALNLTPPATCMPNTSRPRPPPPVSLPRRQCACPGRPRRTKQEEQTLSLPRLEEERHDKLGSCCRRLYAAANSPQPSQIFAALTSQNAGERRGSTRQPLMALPAASMRAVAASPECTAAHLCTERVAKRAYYHRMVGWVSEGADSRSLPRCRTFGQMAAGVLSKPREGTLRIRERRRPRTPACPRFRSRSCEQLQSARLQKLTRVRTDKNKHRVYIPMSAANGVRAPSRH